MFGIVEIMGHRTRAGALSDVTIGGGTMLRIEHPTLADPENDHEPLAEFYSPSAIFAIRPCSAAEATAAAERCWSRPPLFYRPELAPPFDDMVEDDLDEYDADDRHNPAHYVSD